MCVYQLLKPTVGSNIHHNQWTEPIVRFWVLQNPLKNWTELNLTILTQLWGKPGHFKNSLGHVHRIIYGSEQNKKQSRTLFTESYMVQSKMVSYMKNRKHIYLIPEILQDLRKFNNTHTIMGKKPSQTQNTDV